MNDIEFSALMVSRVCHDLVGPLGAVVNGLEVLEDERDAAMREDALKLVTSSANQALARIQFMRIAFGAAGSAGAELDLGEIGRLIEGLLEGAARSFKQHGFRDVFFLGDHGGYQQSEQRVAEKLNREWKNDPACRVHALADYYRVTQTTFVDALRKKGYSAAEIGTHAGLNDTSLAMAVDPALVRADVLAAGTHLDSAHGVYGDPRRATAELGQAGVDEIVNISVAAIQRATAAKR